MKVRKPTGRRRAVAAAILAAAIVPAAGTAVGTGGKDLGSVSIRQLQSPAQLPDTPQASVPVPQVPQTPVPTPSVPQVSTPSVPHVSTPSTPSVSTPQVSTPSAPGVSTPSATAPQTTAGAGGGSAAPGTPGDPSTANGSGEAAGGSSAGATAAMTPKQRAQVRRERRHARERHVRHQIRRYSGCLGAVSDDEARYLSLRGGLDGPPRSRGEAAQELGITTEEAARLERHGLRGLRAACGSGGTVTSPGAARTLADSGSMPALQPAALIEHTGGGKPLVEPQKLRGHQEVQGEEQSSADIQNGGKPPAGRPTTATTHPLAAATTTEGSAIWIVLGATAALLAVMAVLAFRGALGHRARSTGGGAAMMSAPVAPPLLPPRPAKRERPEQAAPRPEEPPEPEPDASSAETAVHERPERPSAPFTEVPPQPPLHDEPRHRSASRTAAIAASGALSFVAREFLKRRGRSGRRRRR